MMFARWPTLLFATLLTGCGADEQEIQRFDTAHVEAALAYFETPDAQHLRQIAETPAAQHLLKHSRVTGYYPPDATALDITRELVKEPPDAKTLATVNDLLGFLENSAERQTGCIEDARRHLPADFRYREPLYITWGYDIGVSMNGSASINLAHPRFADDPDELWFYCTHEMHHAGLTSYQPFPLAIADIASAADMLRFIRYATMLEGTAVHAAYEPRRKAGALNRDPDYVALDDVRRMAAYEQAYWEIYVHFERAGKRAITDEDWQLVEKLSDGDRLWYRVGALMAAEIEKDVGAAAYRELAAMGPDAFFSYYWQEPLRAE